MTGRDRVVLPLLLVLMGAGWGLGSPLSKLAVSGGYQPIGLVFWQLTISAAILGLICIARGRSLRPRRRHLVLYVVLALAGTVLPNAASYRAAMELPAGVLSILISMVPMFAFPMALMLGLDRFSLRRLGGLMLGLAGVALLVGPEASLPDRAMAVFIPLALVAPFFYAIEGNFVALRGTGGLDPVQTLFGAAVTGALITLPIAIGTGQFIDPRPPWGLPDAALMGSSTVHALVYSAYVWMVGRAGAVFAAQVSYLVTIFGVGWAMLLLGEAYSPYIWSALILMLGGLSLVQPRARGGQNLA